MPAPSTIAEFVELVRKSGVAENDLIDSYLEKQNNNGDAPTDPNRFASQMVREGVITFFQAEQLLLGKWKRFHIGKYKVLERLGQGGMGQVFLCEHMLMRRRVAVKVLPTARAEDPIALERFYREARAVAALDHVNLVRAFDIDQDENLHFLVMEYVDGVNFMDLVKKSGPMDALRACHYIRQAAIGLDYAHQVAGLVHRDIKPGNILVDRIGIVKILDMGLARFFNDSSDDSSRQLDEPVIGTADYLSPEQAHDSFSADIRSDLYSLGATFYFMLTGRPPFPDGSVAQKLIAHQTRMPTPLQELRPEIPMEVADVVERLMQKSPGDRFQTPALLDEALIPLTITPIPPPPDSEMPTLSLAAVASSGSVVTSIRRLGVPSGSMSRIASSISLAAPRNTSISTIIRGPSEGSKSPPYGTPFSNNGGAATPSPGGSETHELDSANPFRNLLPGSSLKTKGAAPIEAVYTPPKGTPPIELPLEAPSDIIEEQQPKSNPWIYVAAGVLIAVGAGFGMRMWQSRDTETVTPVKPTTTASKPAPAPSQPSGHEWFVDNIESPSSVRSIAAALRRARPGDRILIKIPMIEETMVFDGANLGRGEITIESGLPGDEPILWLLPRHASVSTPIVDILGRAGVTFRNITFDGQNRAETLIRCAGSCPATTVDRVHFRGFTKSAIRLTQAVGSADHPITVQNSRFQSTGKSESAIALYSSVTKQPVQFIRISNCIADGSFNNVIEGEGSASELMIERNRFYQASTALHWKRFDQEQFLKAQLVNNTFVEMRQAAVQLDSLPQDSETSTITLRNNLIVKCGVIVQVNSGDRPGFIVASHTVRDADTSDAHLPEPARVEENITFQSNNPALRDFLRYPKSHKLASAGNDGGPVGAPPVN
jgi:serine/threonine protein kinase